MTVSHNGTILKTYKIIDLVNTGIEINEGADQWIVCSLHQNSNGKTIEILDGNLLVIDREAYNATNVKQITSIRKF